MKKANFKKINVNFLLFVLVVIVMGNHAYAREKTGYTDLGSNLLVKSVKVTPCIIKLPNNFDRGKEYPLIIALHGNGGSADSFAGIWNDFENPQFIFAVPEGPYSYAHSSSRNSGMYSWYLENTSRDIWEIADPISEEFILNIVDAAKKKYKVSKVFILGFSQGGALAYAVGIKNSSMIDGIISVGGPFPNVAFKGNQISAGSSLPILIAAGNRDVHMSLKKLKTYKDFFEKKGYKVTDFVYEGGHQITKELLRKIQEWTKRH